MKSIYKIYFVISFSILLLLLSSIYFFTQESEKDKLQELRRFTVAKFEKELNRQKDELLIRALALSKNNALKESLVENNQTQAKELLSNISSTFVTNTVIERLRLQLITKELHIFAQNWKNDEGEELKNFRPDLVELQKNNRVKVGIETGRRLTFKATIPLQVDGEYIGYLEVIQFVDEFVEKLRTQGIELFTLMDKEYIIDDSLMKGFPLLKDYVIANENYDRRLKQKAEAFSWKELERLGQYEDNGRLFILKDMLNNEKTVIGKYLIILRKNMFIAYKDSYQDTSIITRFSDQDIDNYIKDVDNLPRAYRSFKDRELVEILPKLYKKDEDREVLRTSAKGILQGYSKDELIDIILENNHKEKKIGVVQ